MAQKILLDGRKTWLKNYDEHRRSRRAATRVWNLVAGSLGTKSLRAPPLRGGEEAKRIEVQRINELRDQGVRVPRVLAEGRRVLLLSDIGPSLSSELKTAANDAVQVDSLVHDTIGAIASVHRRDAYLGQAFARNITVADGRIGFIDFEEDPREIMSLRDAQVRDWLMFAAGVSRHYEGRSDSLAAMLSQVQPHLEGEVIDELKRSAQRLGFLHRMTRRMGVRARALGVAVMSVRKGFGVLLLGLLTDMLLDGDSDVFNFLQDLL